MGQTARVRQWVVRPWGLIVLGVSPALLAAQGTGVVRGQVRERGGESLSGAQVRLVSPGNPSYVTESDDGGRFRIPKVPAGSWWVVVRRIGYRPDSVRVATPDSTEVTVSLPRLPIALAAVRVEGRRNLSGPMEGFYRRMQTNGGGRFLTRAEIERRNVMNMTDIFRMVPGVRIETRGFTNHIRMRGARCAPLVWLDGAPMYAGEVDLDGFDARSFEGIEIYSGPASVPVEYQGNSRMNASCGVIILWSRRGELRERKRKADEPTPSERIAKALEERSAFGPNDVDYSAQPDSTELVRPVYPDSLFDALVPGRVMTEFIVDTTGRALMDTFSAVTTTHRLFVEPVRRAVRDQSFVPASRQGRVVRQVVQIPFDFIPDSTARRSR